MSEVMNVDVMNVGQSHETTIFHVLGNLPIIQLLLQKELVMNFVKSSRSVGFEPTPAERN